MAYRITPSGSVVSLRSWRAQLPSLTKGGERNKSAKSRVAIDRGCARDSANYVFLPLCFLSFFFFIQVGVGEP